MHVRTQRHAALAFTAAAFGAVGFLGGLLAAGDGAPVSVAPRAASAAPGATAGAVAVQADASLEAGCAHGVESPADLLAAASQVAGPPQSGPEGEAVGPFEPVDFGPFLAAARAMRDAVGPDEEEACDAAAEAADALFERVSLDPAALADALARFGELRDPAELDLLAAVLGRIADPEVEELALALAAQGTDAQRAAAFDVLDGIDSPRAREVALTALARDGDTRVRQAALKAIPDPAGASLDEARGVAQALGPVLAGDPDVETRRRAAIVLARHTDDVAPVLAALTGDPDPGVRAGAAFALEVTQRRDPRALAALVAVLETETEDPLVHENAWRALGALSPLPPDVHAAYERYREVRDAAGEAQ